MIRMQAELVKHFLKLLKNRALMSLAFLAVLTPVVVLIGANNDQSPNITANKPLTSGNSIATSQTLDTVGDSNNASILDFSTGSSASNGGGDIKASTSTQSSSPSPSQQSTPSTSGSSPSGSTYAYKPYVAPVCTKVPIPYKTTYENANYIPVGETQTFGGTDGYIDSCTADSTGYKPSDITLQPQNKIIYVGTKPVTSPAEAYQQCYDSAKATADANNQIKIQKASQSHDLTISSINSTYPTGSLQYQVAILNENNRYNDVVAANQAAYFSALDNIKC